jgi:hypothetical protein
MSKRQNYISTFLGDFFLGLTAYKNAYAFIREHRLWDGMTRYKGIIVIFILIGLVLGVKIFDIVQNMVQTRGISEMGLINTMSMVKDVARESYNLLFLGGMKYLVLIFFEIAIFHFVRRTMEIKTGRTFEVSFQAFLDAQVRMIKVVILSFFMEIVMSIMIGIAVGILGVEFLKVFLVLLVQMYFLGFAFIDNYNELFHMGIKESEKDTRKYLGVAIAIGSVAYGLLLIPIAGSIIAPILGGVAATLVMYEIKEPVFKTSEREREPEQAAKVSDPDTPEG